MNTLWMEIQSQAENLRSVMCYISKVILTEKGVPTRRQKFWGTMTP
jgi:hypothetical protein